VQIRAQASEVILGVDTHKQAHVVAALDGLGRRLSVAEFPADDSGGRRLLEWARQHGQVRAAGVEGTGSYGYRLARQFADAGITVVEVNRPDRSRRRRRGKSDPVDAEAAARAVLAGDATAIPKDRQGPVGALRALVVARRSAVKARTQAANQIHALLIGCDDDLRRRLARRRDRDLAQACSQLRAADGIELALRSLGRRWQALSKEVAGLDADIAKRVRRTAPKLLDRHGVGVHTAAQLLVTGGDNPDRLTSEAAFAALCGASPVEASSGKTVRHRLNRGGDRAANTALWTIAHVRLLHDPRTRRYADRRRAAGNSRKEILRLVKRYIARELYPIILTSLCPATATSSTSGRLT
jgi:transposase